MSIVTANITAGAVNLSGFVTVAAAVADGTTVVVARGEYTLGSGVITSGVATVAVPALATGDIIQASVTERGNQSGIPVVVLVAPTPPSGWLTASTIAVYPPGGGLPTYLTADQYFATYGEKVGATYDPIATGKSQLPIDYDKQPVAELGFDVSQVQVAGSTVVRVIPRNSEGLLVGWNGATPTTPAALTLTTSATITVTVQRDDSATTLTRSMSIVVLPAPTAPATPAAGDITSAAWRLYDNNFVRAFINSSKPCEALLVGYTSTWQAGTSYALKYQEVDWAGPVPSGTYTCQCRVIGETNSANYYTFIISF